MPRFRARLTAALLLLPLPLLGQRVHPWTQPGFDLGRVAPQRTIGLVTVFLKRTAAQQAALEKLLEDQRNPASADYHRWLTPEQFAARFGAGAHDAAAVADWLRSQGLSVERVARGRNWVSFSGTASRVEAAFQTELHHYYKGGELHVAPLTTPSIPEALAGVVDGIAGLDDFDFAEPVADPRYTYSSSIHALAPDDFAVIYDVAPLYAAGITGAGQAVAVAARSEINLSDVQFFQSLFGLPLNPPQVKLYGPDPGFAKSQNENTGDTEGILMVARDATVVLVTTTNSITSVVYAVDDQIAPVITFSYGGCEMELSATAGQYTSLQIRSIAQQANAEGITWVAASGDYGAAGCDTTQPATIGLSADFPATIPEVTAAGGTMFNEGNGNYWNSSNTQNGASAISYIPEVAWNETTSSNAKSASTGGASTIFSKPAWQAAPGVPADGARDVPDIALNASGLHDPDIGATGGSLVSNGGTSVAAPSFAGILALLNQYLVGNGALTRPGLGNVNPNLYRLARTVPSVFHDITDGNTNRPCTTGAAGCVNGMVGYAAGPGYDMATGLGSLDVYKLVTSWNTVRSASTTILSASAATVAINGSIQLTVSVAAPAGSPAATGEVAINNGVQLIGTAHLTAAGTATITLYGSQLTAGAVTLTATYSGDANLDGSSGSVALNVAAATGGSAVIPSISPNPVYTHTQPDGNGNTLFYMITLSESAGIGTTVTGVTVDGASQPVASFFPSATIPANGAISVQIAASATVTPSARVYGFSGVDASGFQWRQEVTAFFLGAQLLGITGVANAASGSTNAMAPGEIVSMYGSSLSPYTMQATTVPLPISLGGVSVRVNGTAAPLYFVSPGQINLQLPNELTPGTATILINNNGQNATPSPFDTVQVATASPGIFVDGNGNTVPFAAGSRGQTYTLFLTGYGAVSPAVATGAGPAAGTDVSQLPAPVGKLVVSIGGESVPVTFAGIPAGLVGVMQVNFEVPNDALLGPQPVVVSVGGVVSKGSATFTVGQ